MKKGFLFIFLLSGYSKIYCQKVSEETWDVASIKTCHIYKSNVKDTVCNYEIKTVRQDLFLISLTKFKASYEFYFQNTCSDEFYSYLFLKDIDGVYRNEEKSVSFTILEQTNNNAIFRLITNLNIIKAKDPLKRIEYYYCETLK
jgi:hypothetical protein